MRDTVQLETSIGSQRDGYVFPDVLADCTEGDDLILTLCRIGREAAWRSANPSIQKSVRITDAPAPGLLLLPSQYSGQQQSKGEQFPFHRRLVRRFEMLLDLG